MIRKLARRRTAAIAAIVGGLLILGSLPGTVDASGKWSDLDRWDPYVKSPTGQSVAVECNPGQEPGTETWPDATARLRLNERNGHTTLTVRVRDARPDTLYTVWLRLLGEDSEGNLYGGSPLTGIPVTPLAPTDELPEQLAATPPNKGSDSLSNGFHTNHRGHGRLTLHLDFPIRSGAYPFQRFPDWEKLKGSDALAANATIKPVAIPDGSQAPATLLIASHCVDGLGHGLLPGLHENWFNWSLS